MKNAELFARYAKTGDVEIRNRIVESHLYVVDILIRKYLNKGVEYDDLYQIGALALITAADRFDPERGYAFTSFATPTILGEIKKYFRDKEWSLKVPRRLKEINAKIATAKETLSLQLKRTPTIAELAEYMGRSEEEVLEAMESGKAYDAYSLSRPLFEGGEDGTSAERFMEKFMAVEDAGFGRLEYEEIIQKVLCTLNEAERRVFRRRFLENKTQAEIAGEIGVSQMTISRAEKTIRNKFIKELEK